MAGQITVVLWSKLPCRDSSSPISARIVLTAMLLIGLCTAPAEAQFAGGSGTGGDPYRIATAEQLNHVRNHLDAHFRQTADIDLGVAPWTEGEGWVPIGSPVDGASFTGSFDGDGHAIRNLTMKRPTMSYQGLFGRLLNATIQRVTLENASLRSGSFTGALAGSAENSAIEQIRVSGEIRGGDNTGGVLGHQSGGRLSQASSAVQVQGNGQTGGLVGNLRDGSIRQASISGSVQGGDQVGGIAGLATRRGAQVSISVQANPPHAGTVGGGQDYHAGAAATLLAMPAAGWTFVSWSENGTIVSTDPALTFNVSSPRSLVANFDDTPVSVPDVLSLNEQEARAAITDAGLTVGAVAEEASAEVPAWHVIRQSPSAGANVPPGVLVSLTLSRASDSSWDLQEFEGDLAENDPDWSNYPDVQQETNKISETLERFKHAMVLGDSVAASQEIVADRRSDYRELFESNPGAMASFGALLSSAAISYLSEWYNDTPDNRTAEYQVDVDGSSFVLVFMKVEGTWLLYDF